MSNRLSVDVCVVGNEPGGLAVATACALAAVPVALVPDRSMRHDFTAELAAFVAAAQGRIASALDGAGRPDFRGAIAHVRRVRSQIDAERSPARLAALGIRVLEGPASFLSARALDVGGTTVDARRFILATGSRASLPAVAGLDPGAALTTDTVFDLAERPSRIAMVGGGRDGTALAQAFRRFGSEVVLFDRGTILPDEDPELVLAVRQRMGAAGIAIHEHADLTGIDGRAGDLRVSARRNGEDGTLAVSHVLFATGRQAAVDGLALDRAGVAATPGRVEVDAGLMTANRRIFALGRTMAPDSPDEVSAWHGAQLAQNCLFRRPVRLPATAIARSTLTDPQIASVGLSGPSDRHRRSGIRVLRWPLSETIAGIATGRTSGYLKLIVSGKGQVLGCAIAAPDAADLIAPFAMAVGKSLHVQDLAAMILPHQSLSDVGKKAAGTYLLAGLSNPRIRRIIGLFRRLG